MPLNTVFLLSSRRLQKRAMEHPKIQILWNSVVEEAYGNEKGTLGGVKVKNVKTGGAGGLQGRGACLEGWGRATGLAGVAGHAAWSPPHCRLLNLVAVGNAVAAAALACCWLQARRPTCRFRASSLPSATNPPPPSWMARCGPCSRLA